jgi:ATP-dependent helicase/nuclease subunit A
LLEQLDQGGDLTHLDELDEQVSQLFAAPNNSAENTVQIMTIHTAKGLEFDTVILPHLQRKSPNDDKQLLLWMERARGTQQNALILAPISATGTSGDAIYDYIKRQHAIKMDYETARLLYVAVTRAKKNLHLLFNLDFNESDSSFAKPQPKSLLEKLWLAIQGDVSRFAAQPPSDLTLAMQRKTKPIKRLPTDWLNPMTLPAVTNRSRHQSAPGFQLHQHTPKHVGTLIHQILQQIAIHGVAWWQTQSQERQHQYVNMQLISAGVLYGALTDAIELTMRAITNTLADAKGQWILAKHLEAQSELPLTTVVDGECKLFIIDRTFIDEQGTRWIIDYKTTGLGDQSLPAFLQQEEEKHEQQLGQYKQALQQLDNRPISIGLYFPLIPAWFAYSSPSLKSYL